MTNISIKDRDVFKAVRSFLMSFLDCEIRQGYANFVPTPQGSFVVMLPISRTALSTNIHSYSKENDGQQTIKTPTEYRIQIDFYGEDAGEMAQMFVTLVQDRYAFDYFPENIKPLYAEPAREVPFISGEKNFIFRWTTDVHIQFNPSATTPMDYVEEIAVNINLANGKVIS